MTFSVSKMSVNEIHKATVLTKRGDPLIRNTVINIENTFHSWEFQTKMNIHI